MSEGLHHSWLVKTIKTYTQKLFPLSGIPWTHYRCTSTKMPCHNLSTMTSSDPTNVHLPKCHVTIYPLWIVLTRCTSTKMPCHSHCTSLLLSFRQAGRQAMLLALSGPATDWVLQTGRERRQPRRHPTEETADAGLCPGPTGPIAGPDRPTGLPACLPAPGPSHVCETHLPFLYCLSVPFNAGSSGKAPRHCQQNFTTHTVGYCTSTALQHIFTPSRNMSHQAFFLQNTAETEMQR